MFVEHRCMMGSKFSFQDSPILMLQVTVPCFLVQSSKDLAVPTEVVKYMHQMIGGRTTFELLHNVEGHLPQLSHPAVLHPVLQRAILWT